jgi:uncharacterized protein involved in outer membrane biogenesis
VLGRILVFVGGLVAVTLIVALLAPYFVDWTGFRQDFEKQASLILGKKVVVHGDVSARLIPFPSVTMDDVRIGQDDEGQPLVTARRFAMDMEIAPFLSGEARIFEMRIIDPTVHIALQKDGSLDWARTGNPSIPAKTVVLENVRVSGGQLIFEDHQTGRTRKFTDLNFSASAKSLAGPWFFQGHGLLDGQAGNFNVKTGTRDPNGVIRVSTQIRPDDLAVAVDLDGALKMQDLKLRYEGGFTATYGARKDGGSVARAKGSFELGNDRVRVPDYRLELGDATDPYVVTGEATLDTGQKPEFLLTAEGQQIDMNSIGASGEDGKRSRNEQSVPAAERLQTFLSLLADIPVPPVPGKATLKLPAIVSGDTSYRDIAVVAQPQGEGWKIDSASVELPGRTKVEASGDLDLHGNRSFTGALTVASTQPSGLSSWLAGEVAPQVRSLNAAGFSANVSLTDTVQSFDKLELAAGGAILKGRVERQSPDDSTPSLSIDLSGGDLDLDALTALTSLLTGKNSADTFFAHSITAQLALKTLAAEGTVAHDVSTTFSLKDGKLAVDRLAIGDIANASIDLSGTAAGTLEKPQLALKGTFRSADPEAFLALVKSRVEGNPVFTSVQRRAGFYKDSILNFDVTTGGGGDWPVTATLDGTANGTNLSVKLAAEDIGLSAGTGLSLDITAANDNYSTLMGQAGLDPLPLLEGGRGNIVAKISRSGSNPADISLNFTTNTTGLNIKGTGDLSAAGFLDGDYKLLLDSEDMEPFLVQLGYAIPQMGTGLPISANATMTVKPDAISLAGISGKADKDVFSGALSVTRGSKPKLTGDLALDNLDTGWLAELVAGPLEDENGAFSAKPISKPEGAPFDADIALSAKKFWAGYRVPVENFKGKLSYAAGSVALSDVTGEIGGGDANGSISLTAGDGQSFLRGRFFLKSVDTRLFSWNAAPDLPALAGRADIGLVVEGAGASVKQIAARLSGSGKLSFNRLDINGFNVNALPQVLAAADKIDGDIDANKVLPILLQAVGTGRTQVNALTVPISISGGRVRIQNANFDAAGAAISLDGDAGISDSSLNARIRVSLKAGDDVVAGAEPAFTLNVSGSLNAPVASVDATELTSYLSLRAFERERRKADLLQAKLAERQRLRREELYFKSLTDAREAARVEAERKAAEEAAAQKAAAEKAAAEKVAAEKAAAQAAAEDAARQKAVEDLAKEKAAEDARRKGSGSATEIIRGDKLAPPPAAN